MKKLLKPLGLTFLALAVILLALRVPPRASFACIFIGIIVLAVLWAVLASREPDEVDTFDEQMDRIAAIMDPFEHPRSSRLSVTRLDDPTPSSISQVTPIRRGGIDWQDYERQVREVRNLLAPRAKYDPFAVSAELTGEVPEYHPTGRKSGLNIGDRYPILQGLVR